MVIREHSDYHFSAGCIGRSIGDRCARLLQLLSSTASAIVNGDRVPGLEQVPRHTRAHVSKTYESDFHLYSPISAYPILTQHKTYRIHRCEGSKKRQPVSANPL